MDDKERDELVFNATFEDDGRRKLACAAAFKLAAEHDMKLLDVARVCNDKGIKLCKCQLGCFK